ncbi:MAG TPA: DMT family transporter [Candidatus Lustribacter sp.]|nr:DMT family transporter [Candidatus Lustribacter sp.]
MKARALGLLAGAQVAIGAAAIFARFALTAAGPLSVAALRMGIAAVPVVVLALLRRRYVAFDAPTERRLQLAGLALAVHFGTWITSLQYASVAVSTLLVCTTPVFTELWSLAVTRKPRPLALAGLLLAIAGVAIVTGAPSRSDTPLGIALALCGAVAMGAYLLLVRASDPRYTVLAVVGRTYPIAALVLTGAALLAHEGVPPPSAGGAWAGIFALALVSQLFGHTAINAAVRVLSVTFVAMTVLLEPVIAAVAAALVFGERPAPFTAAGALLVFIAIALAIRAEEPSEMLEGVVH